MTPLLVTIHNSVNIHLDWLKKKKKRMSRIRQNSRNTLSSRFSLSFLFFLHFPFICFHGAYASSLTQNIITQHVAVEMGTDVIFNCSSNKPAIWTKLSADGDSARVGIIAFGRILFDEELADKFR